MYVREEGLMGHFCQVWQGLEKGCVCGGAEGGGGENTAEWSIVPQKAGSGQAAPLLPALHIHQPASSTHT
jgi:hypothetical protein